MFWLRGWLKISLACAVVPWGFAASSEDDLYQVGVSRVDITPDYPVRLNGFGNRRDESEGVSQPIFAKALAISQQDGPPLVLVTLDSLGVRAVLVEEVARRLQQTHGLPRENLAVTFTHSHCAPKVNGASDNIFSQAIPADHQQRIDRYTDELTDKITGVVRQAIDDQRPARLQWGIGRVGFAKNRRTEGGPVDHDLPMLVVRDARDDRPRAIYVSYACHCVTLSFNQISGDWAGYAASMIERMVPGVTALVSIGAGSDQNPDSGVTGDQTQIAERQGIEIATEVKRLLAEELKSVAGRPATVLRQIALPLDPRPTRQQLEAQAGRGGSPESYNAITQLARLDRGQELLAQIEYPIQTWTFGDSLCMTFLAGEVCVDYSLRLKLELDRERFWLNAYSNDFCCYIPSERLVGEGGYGGGAEVPYFALPATLQAGLEQRIVDEVLRQVPTGFQIAARTQGVAPQRPLDSLQCIRTPDDLQVQLVAAEPQVTDPVAIDFGADGRLWVAEMIDYGRGVYETFEPQSRVRWLRDRDGDGYFEQAHTFVTGLRFPTDVKVWRDGVLICDAPDILFAEDRDGDGTAESVTKLFSGFETHNAQARVNSLRFGLDNWVYGAGGLFGGTITSHSTADRVDCTNRDFRINPDTGLIEPVSGRAQQGRCRNDWGDWFGCNNGSLIEAISSDDRYLQRNPFFAPPAVPMLQLDAEAIKLYPPENLVTFELSGAPGTATAACGLEIYRDTALGGDHRGDAFTCEPVHQSVHRIDLTAAGHGFSGRRGDGEETREFLSSTDRWFRPVQVRTGPDGGLWIVDMYRYVIEHSRWIPPAALAELDVFAGQRFGRIYRVLPRAQPAAEPLVEKPQALPDLTALTNPELVNRLDVLNGPHRDLAHQLLLWRGASDVVPEIQRLVSEATTSVGTIHALAVLDGLKKLSESDLLAALKSDDPEVVRFAVGLSEPFLEASPPLGAAIAGLAHAESVRVRRQVALSIGEATNQDGVPALVHLLSRGEADAHVRAAALNSLSSRNIQPVLDEYLELLDTDREPSTYQNLLQIAIDVGGPKTVNRVLRTLLPAPESVPSAASVEELIEALSGLDARSRSQRIESEPDVRERLRSIFRWALEAVDAEGDGEETRVGLALLGRPLGAFTQSALEEGNGEEPLPVAERVERIARLISPRSPAPLQRLAIEAVAATGAPEVSEILLAAFPSLNAESQQTLIDTLLTQQSGAQGLVSAIESGIVRPDFLDASRRARLLSNLDQQQRSAAESLFGSQRESSRSAVIETRLDALELPGDAARGRLLYRKHCSACHQLEDHGHHVGPDLRGLTNRDPRWLLTAILDPNRDVDARYVSWLAITQDGQTVNGMIVEENATTIRLREAGGKEHLIERTDIEAFRSTQRSLMPDGLEQDMSSQDLRDVIEFLSVFESPYKQIAGNAPQRIHADAEGRLSLTAATAEIRGGDITFETPFANLGFWHDQRDSATWKVAVAAQAEFDIYLELACADAVAGNSFRIDGLPQPIVGTVAGTGGWDQYRFQKIATAVMPAGDYVVTLRSEGPVRQALLDLRQIRMLPAGVPAMVIDGEAAAEPLPRYPVQIATFLLDESQSPERRHQVIGQRPGMGPAIIAQLVEGIEFEDLDQQYQRIPWIWRVAHAVGQRNDGGEIRELLELSVPGTDSPLRDWQAVVIGGGLINGVSQLGLWPRQRLAEILSQLPALDQAWPRALELAAKMADDQQVRSGTRYDALRMVALREEVTAIAQLRRYLVPEAHHELQMGAVSGLTDIDSPDVGPLILDALPTLQGENRRLAIEGMLRSDGRTASLLSTIESGQVPITATEIESLMQHRNPAIRNRADRVRQATARP